MLELVKLIIQRLLRLYNRDIYSDLTKTKVLLMASIGKGAFNIDGLIIHLTLNIHVQKSLLNLLNLSLCSLNTFTCRCEQLQLEMINEVSFVGVRMFNIIDIKHIHKTHSKQTLWWC
jgi:hypothetical protein